MKIANDVTELIGNTPLVAQAGVFQPGPQRQRPHRLSMIEPPNRPARSKPDTIILEPTSGNTGIALAMVCAARGYRCTLTMPETMSKERRMLLRAYGAELILTPGSEGMAGAIRKAEELAASRPALLHPAAVQEPGQPGDPPPHHRRGDLARHRRAGGHPGVRRRHGWDDHRGRRGDQGRKPSFPGGGGRARRLARALGRAERPHPIQGIGAGFVPEVLNTGIYDEIIRVKNEDAFETARRMAREEGLLVGISSGAAVWAAMQVAQRPRTRAS
jgi:cysteine synthase